MKKEQPRERIREEMQERPARSRNTSSFAASTRKKAARSARPTGSVSHPADQEQKCTPCQSGTGKEKSGGTPEKTPQKEFPSGYSNGASSGSRIVWRRVLLIAEGTFLWQTGTGI